MSSDHPPRRMLPALGLLALAFPSLAVAAPATPDAAAAESASVAAAGIASPASYEQIDRANGPRGATTLKSLITAEPVFASDDGRVGAYSGGPSAINLTFAPVTTVVRNAVTDRSTDLGTVAGKLLQVDRSETLGLFRQRTVDLEANTVVTSYSVARLDGRGPVRDLGIGYQYATVVLSGNGKYVVASTNDGLRRLNLATGVWTTIATFGAIEPRSVSDDGLTIAAVDFNPDTQEIASVVFRGATPTRTVLVSGYPYAGNGTGPQLSPDGSTVVSFKPQLLEDQPPKFSIQDLPTGKVVETAIPYENNAYDARPVWISPSGDRVAVALGNQYQGFGDPLQPAKVFNTRTGKWSEFGGAFATSIKSSPTTLTMPSAISRNGQYAVVEYNTHAALVRLDGRALPGEGPEPLAASSYLSTQGLDFCFANSSSFLGVFTRPAAWVKAPRKARITVSKGKTVLATANWTNPTPFPGDQATVDNSIYVKFPAGQITRNVAFSVVDGYGRQLDESYSEKVTCGS